MNNNQVQFLLNNGFEEYTSYSKIAYVYTE